MQSGFDLFYLISEMPKFRFRAGRTTSEQGDFKAPERTAADGAGAAVEATGASGLQAAAEMIARPRRPIIRGRITQPLNSGSRITPRMEHFAATFEDSARKRNALYRI
jgi:hypothetical protein